MARQLSPDLFPRHAGERVAAALEDTRVVVLNGARQVGKSTLAEIAVDARAGSIAYYLDRDPTRDAASADPISFVRHSGLMMIDEIRRVPELLLAIKNEVDRDPWPGRFLLTGSAKPWGMKGVPDILPGRSETVELWPLSQGEITGEPDGFVDAVFADEAPDLASGTLRRADYIALALRGGFPEAVRRQDTRRRARFFESYISDLIERDIRQISEIERIHELRQLVRALAAMAGGLLVANRLASDLAIPATTVRRHLAALDLVYVIRQIPAWSNNLTRRAVGTPKMIFVGSGLAPDRHVLPEGVSPRGADRVADGELRARRTRSSDHLGRGAGVPVPLP